jgi:hypothetical protein
MGTTAPWATNDETTLINYLAEHVAAVGDGRNFKLSTYRDACKEVNKRRTVGGPKTDRGCKRKWTAERKP